MSSIILGAKLLRNRIYICPNVTKIYYIAILNHGNRSWLLDEDLNHFYNDL